jgi:hypothetical protein
MAEKLKRKKKTQQTLTDKEQSERFKETARKLGLHGREDFDRMVSKIAPIKRSTKSS